MPGNRMSILPQTQRCGRAPELSAISSTGNALLGTAWHAHNLQPGSPEAKAALAKLSPEELDEVLSWPKPPPTETPHGLLVFEEMEHELEVGLDANGEYCDPGSADCVSVGHLDMAKVLGDTAYVVDAKRSEWTTADGPDTLQVRAYGLAYASKNFCRYVVTGVWACIEGRFWWAEEPLDMWSEEADALRARVVAAALNQGGSHVVGSWCRGCYGRKHCPAWLMPYELVGTTLGPLAGGEQTPNNMLELLVQTQRLEDTVARAKELIKAYSLDNGGIVDPATGKRWAGVRMPGRKSLNTAAMVADGIDPQKYQREGSSYDQMRWVNVK